MRTLPQSDARRDRGMSLVELLIALIVLAVGVLAVAGLFPAATHSQLQSRIRTTASYYAQQKVEDLEGLSFSDTALTAGRHPGGIATEALGASSEWRRYYQVTNLASPMDNLKRVTVNVSWTYRGTQSVIDTTYVRK